MKLTSFEKFAELPVELQDLIWEAAVRPNDSQHRRQPIHYFTIQASDKEIRRVEKNWFQTSWEKVSAVYNSKNALVGLGNVSTSCPRTRSACLWDAGLWTACHQSRKIMEKRYPPPPPMPPIEYPQWADGDATGFIENTARCEYRGECPTMIVAEHNRTEFRAMVHLGLDVFCVTPRDLITAILCAGRERYWVERDFKKPAPVTQLAVEFHESWCDQWPRSYQALRAEDSARSRFARALAFHLEEHELGTVWLIDPQRRPGDELVRDTSEVSLFTYYDCDHEYVETQAWKILRRYNQDLPCAGNFVRKLDILMREGGRFPPAVDWTSYVNILTRAAPKQ